MSSFFRGMRFALAGMVIFYRDGTWWKYAAKVWGVLFIFYAGVVWLIFRLAAMTADLLGGRLGALPAFLRSRSVREIVALFRRRRGELLGFGITVYFSQLLPFTLPLTLPGVILGAVMLYHGTFPAVPPEERRKVTEKDGYLP